MKTKEEIENRLNQMRERFSRSSKHTLNPRETELLNIIVCELEWVLDKNKEENNKQAEDDYNAKEHQAYY